MTWEAASTLPRALIDEFESGMVSAGEIITDTKFGAIHHTLVVGRSSATIITQCCVLPKLTHKIMCFKLGAPTVQ